MGLLSSYSDYNKVTDTALQVKYACVPDTYEAYGWIPDPNYESLSVLADYTAQYWRVHRYATKSYRYVGMDLSTATACQSAKISQYTRPFSRVIWQQEPIVNSIGQSQGQQDVLSTEYTYECKSDIACQHDGGGMWSVQINVNEEDEKFSYELPQDPASLFAAENQRNYDQVWQQPSPNNIVWVSVDVNS